MHDVGAVAQDLHLDVSRPSNESFEVHASVTERRRGLLLRGGQSVTQLVVAVRDSDPASAAAGGRLDQNGITDIVSDSSCRVDVPNESVASRYYGYTRLPSGGDGLRLVAHLCDGGRIRTDPHEARRFDCACEAGILGKEAIAWMDGVGVTGACCVEQRIVIQVALLGMRWTDSYGLVGEVDGRRLAIRIAVRRDRGYAQFLCCANGPKCNLSTTDDQESFDLAHYYSPIIRRTTWPTSTGSPSSTSTSWTVPSTPAASGVNIFITSTTPTESPDATRAPTGASSGLEGDSLA